MSPIDFGGGTIVQADLDALEVSILSAHDTDVAALRTEDAGRIAFGNVVIPEGHELAQFSSAASAPIANSGYVCRFRIPKTGTLSDLFIWPTVSSGNLDVGVYSTAATRARLWSLGSTAMSASVNQWVNIGSPALSVAIGDVLDVFIGFDNTVARLATHSIGTALMQLPTGLGVASGGAAGKFNGRAATVFPLPATIAEASILTSNFTYLVIGKIT